MKKVMLVFGTRPEAIKMCPLVKEFQKHPDEFETIVCVTGQHREMLDQVLKIFEVKPDFDLNIMKQGQDLTDVTARVLTGMRDVFSQCRPDVVLVHGDTTTSTAAALAAFYQQIPVGHVEAGLRTHNIYSPWPEEMNRQITGRIATYNFSPTPLSEKNLQEEKVHGKIYVTGNTVIDALHLVVNKLKSDTKLAQQQEAVLATAGYDVKRLKIAGQTGNDDSHARPDRASQAGNDESHARPDRASQARNDAPCHARNDESHDRPDRASQPRNDELCQTRNDESHARPDRASQPGKLVLITGHRRENFGDGFIRMVTAIRDLKNKYPEVDFVYPMHLNPNVRKPIHEVFGEDLSGLGNMFFIEPLQYLEFVYLMEKSTIVLTDSGGIQEEAPGLGKPVLVMRDTTERPEALSSGTVHLVGTDYDKIMNEVSTLLEDEQAYAKMSKAVNPYGDGKACERIVTVLKNN